MTSQVPNRYRQLLGIVLGTLISALCIWMVLSKVQWNILLGTLRSVGPVWISVALGLNGLRIGSLVWRWHFLLARQGGISWSLAFESLAVGYSANTLLPLRAGDAARMGGVAHFSNIPLGKITAAIILERLGDGISLLMMAGISLMFLPDKMMDLLDNVFLMDGNTLQIGGAFLLLLVVAAVLFRQILDRVFPGQAAVIRKLISDLKAGLITVRSPRMLTGWLGLSILTWLIEAATYLAVFFALDIGIPPSGGLVSCAWGSLVVMIPSAPGGFGSFELALQTLLAFYDCNPSQGLAASLLIHTIVLLPITMIGAIWIPKWVRSFSKTGT